MKNNYRKLKWKLMLRTIVLSLVCMLVGGVLLKLLIDGLFQTRLPNLVIAILMQFNISYERANEIYGQVFMEHKDIFLIIGFVLLFFVFFYGVISKITSYLNDIGNEIENILSDSEAPVSLAPELRPIADRLNTLKMTLKRREDAAVDSEQRKNDLVVYLAHDLKTPLTSVIAYLTMLDEHKDMETAERSKYIHISLEKAIRLGELISEFFEITRFNLQDIVLEKTQVNVSMMLEQLADESYAVLAEKTMTCSIHTDEDMIVYGDPDKLARVFDNLIRNAVAYSYPGTNLDIRGYLEMNTIVIIFTNQGDQIPQQKLVSIFEKFYRADSARSSQTGGAGLGLSIAKEIVELHGGTIEAASDRQGTRFIVRLPKHRETEEQKKRRGSRNGVSKNE